MTVNFYVAATDKMTWGRGTKPWEAIGHALQHSGLEVALVSLFLVECPEGTTEQQVFVSLGGLVAPEGSRVQELPPIKAFGIVRAFNQYIEELKKTLEDQ